MHLQYEALVSYVTAFIEKNYYCDYWNLGLVSENLKHLSSKFISQEEKNQKKSRSVQSSTEVSYCLYWTIYYIWRKVLSY